MFRAKLFFFCFGGSGWIGKYGEGTTYPPLVNKILSMDKYHSYASKV